MTTLLLVLFFFLLAFAGLAIGVILRNKRLRGGCGGPAQGDCKEGSGSCSCKDEKPR
ncbi:MAG: hypothetical protein U1D97_11310 [Desulfuromonadales bacterium]|nr:hypothetical protein [Desulfuromonadales bacterium]